MKLSHIIKSLMGLLIVSTATNINDLCAQNSNRESNPARAGGEFNPGISAGSNVISAREVSWTDSRGMKETSFVLFEKSSQQIIVTPSIKQVCFYNGRFLLCLGGAQSFRICVSTPTEMHELDEESALKVGARVFPDQKSIAKQVSLKPMLKAEDDLNLAQALILRTAEPKVEVGKLVVYFESYSHLKGKVVLDDQFNPISMALTNKQDAK
jgi:hypothetical protein